MDAVSSPTTVVTGLFDLATREGSPRRSVADYLAMARPVLATEHGLVVVCDPELEAPVRAARTRLAGDDAAIDIVPRALEALHAADWVPSIEADLRDGRRNPVSTDPVKDTARYLALGWAKPALVAEAARRNPFGSHRFWWADFGLGHVARPHPARTFDEVLDGATAPLHVHFLWSIDLAEVRDRVAWYRDNAMPRVAGGLFGGSPEALTALAEWFDVEAGRCLATGYPATEEVVLGPVVAEHRGACTGARGSHEEILELLGDPPEGIDVLSR